MECVKLNEFSLEFWQSISEKDSNVIVSPLSVQMAFSMVLAGARSKSASQLKKCLRIGENVQEKEWQSAFKLFIDNLNQLNSDHLEVRLANRLFVRKDIELESPFQQTIKQYYSSAVESVDMKDSVKCAALICSWVENETNKKIKNIISAEFISVDTQIVLVNAIFFKGKWLHSFDKDKTKKGRFTSPKHQKQNVQMMRLEMKLNGLDELNGKRRYQCVQLPFKNTRFSLVILLPAEGELLNIEKNLNMEEIDRIMTTMWSQNVYLSLPRFKVEFELNLIKVMKSLGAEYIFTAEADLSRIYSKDKLFVSKAIHKAFLAVDEEGAEASAATRIEIMQVCGGGPRPHLMIMNVNHPFITWVWDNTTKSILFMSRVTEIIDP